MPLHSFQERRDAKIARKDPDGNSENSEILKITKGFHEIPPDPRSESRGGPAAPAVPDQDREALGDLRAAQRLGGPMERLDGWIRRRAEGAAAHPLSRCLKTI